MNASQFFLLIAVIYLAPHVPWFIALAAALVFFVLAVIFVAYGKK